MTIVLQTQFISGGHQTGFLKPVANDYQFNLMRSFNIARISNSSSRFFLFTNRPIVHQNKVIFIYLGIIPWHSFN